MSRIGHCIIVCALVGIWGGVLQNPVFAQEGGITGDVTGDGIIDGRDALMIMRIIDGLDTVDAEVRQRGDVYPVPGTDGRTMGDGQLTQDDALRILQSMVGLIPLGEISGNYTDSPPRITDFYPHSGSWGTPVTIEGENFSGSNPNENLIYIGGVQAPIQAITGTRIMTEVPVGAQTGLIRVLTPGGTASSDGDFFVTQKLQGQLRAGSDLNPSNFTIVNRYGESKVAQDGTFEIPMIEDELLVVGAAPNGGPNNTYLSILMSDDGANDFVIDARSTAFGLIFLHPFFMTNDRTAAQLVYNTLQTLAEFDALVGVVERRYNESADGLDDPEVKAAWETCVAVLLRALPQTLVADTRTGRQGKVLRTFSSSSPQSQSAAARAIIMQSESDNPAVRIYGVDRHFTTATWNEEERAIEPDLDNGYSPLDWIVALFRVDPDALPQGLNTPFTYIRSHGLRHLNYSRSSLLAANQWTARIDVLGSGVDLVLGEVFDWMSQEESMVLQNNEEAVYILRVFSGSVRDEDGWDNGAIESMEDGPRLARSALMINVVLSLVDLWGLISGDEASFSREAIKSGFQAGLTALNNESGGMLLGEMDDDRALNIIFNVLIEVGKGIAAASIDEGISQAQERLQGTLQTALRSASGLLQALSTISSIGKIGERVAGLMGYLLNPFDMELSPGPSPLETMLVMVGDPYRPSVTSVEPTRGAKGTEVTIRGESFGVNANENLVYFEEQQAEIVSGDTSHIVVRVPSGILGSWEKEASVYITVETPASSNRVRSPEPFQVLRSPVVSGIDPDEGYGAAPGITDGPYANFAGSRIRIEGSDMMPLDDDEQPYLVSVGGHQATIVDQREHFIDVSCPTLDPGEWDVIINDPNTQLETRPLTFTVYGQPRITSFSPTEAHAGEFVEIIGENFYQAQIQIGSDFVSPTQSSKTRLLFRLPAYGGENEQLAVTVFNPVGRTAARHVTRLPGINVPLIAPFTRQGYFLYITSIQAGDITDGKISLDEASLFINKSINLLERDDQNQQTVEVWSERRDADGNPYLKKVDEHAETPDPLTNGPRRHELHYYYKETRMLDGSVTRTLIKSDDLDATDDALEEADRIFVDTNNFESYDPNQSINHIYVDIDSDISALKVELTPQDTLYFNNGRKASILYGIDVAEGCEVRVHTIETGEPIHLVGSAIVFSGTVTGTTEKAMYVENGFGNQLNVNLPDHTGDGLVIEGGGAHTVYANVNRCGGRGIVLKNTYENDFYQITFGNCERGALYLEDSDRNNFYDNTIDRCGFGVYLKDSEYNILTNLIIDNCSDFGIKVDGGGYNHLGGNNLSYLSGTIKNCRDGIVMTNTRNNQMSNVSVRQCSGTGLFFGPAFTYHEFYQILVDGCGDGLVLIGPDTHDNTIGGCQFGLYEKQQYSQVWFSDGLSNSGVTIMNGAHHNTLENCSIFSSPVEGVRIAGAATHSNHLKGCSIGSFLSAYVDESAVQANQGDGVLIEDGAYGNTIETCNIARNQGNGVKIQGSQTRLNTIYNCKIGSDDANFYGNPLLEYNHGTGVVLLDGVPGTRLENNLIGINLGGGINIDTVQTIPDGSAYSLILLNNDISIHTKAITAFIAAGGLQESLGPGLSILDSSNLLIEGNWVSRYGDGILIDGPGNNTIIDNSVNNITGVGMRITGSENDTISGYSATSAPGGGLVLTGTQNASISDISASGNSSIVGISLEGCENTSIQDSHITVSHPDSIGILINGCLQTLLARINMSSSGSNGVEIGGQSNGVTIDDLRVNGAGGSCLMLKETENVHVTGNPPLLREDSTEIYGFLNAGGPSVYIDNCRNVQLGDTSRDLKIMLNGKAGVVITGENTNDVGIQNCSIYRNGEEGIFIDGGKNIRIGGTVSVEGNHLGSNQKAGVLAKGSDTSVSILNNVFGYDSVHYYYGNEYGVVLDDGIHNVLISGNTINSSYKDGIMITGGANHNLIAHNSIYSNRQYGIQIEGGTSLYNQISRNSITQNSREGIKLNGGNNSIAAPLTRLQTGKVNNISGHIEAPDGSVIEVFADTGNEGKKLAGTAILKNNNYYLSAPIPEGWQANATITYPDGNTSEFGSCMTYITPGGNTSGGKNYVYTAGADGNADIYRISPSMEQPLQLTNYPGFDGQPELSPFGGNVIFVSDRTGNLDLWLMTSDGLNQIPLTSDPAGDYDPSWQPGSNLVAFTSERGGNADIYVSLFDPNAAMGEIYPGGDDLSDYDEPWTGEPGDGAGVQFDSMAGLLSHFLLYITSDPAPIVWKVYPVENGQIVSDTAIAEGNATPNQIGWNIIETGDVLIPEEYIIAVFCTEAGRPGIGLSNGGFSNRWWTFSTADGTWTRQVIEPYMIKAFVTPLAPTQITSDNATDREPCWSSNGQQIVFSSNRGGNFDLWIVNADGAGLKQLTSGAGNDSKPSWCPLDDIICFVSDRDGNLELYTILPDGSGLARLTDDEATDTDPVWANSNFEILFASDRDSGMEIYQYNLRSRPVRLSVSNLDLTEPHIAVGSGKSGKVIRHANDPLAAGGALQLVLSDGAANRGETVILDLTLEGAAATGNLAFDLRYNQNQVELTNLTEEGFLLDSLIAVNPESYPSDRGLLRFNSVKAPGWTGDSPLMKLEFTIRDRADRESVEIELLNVHAYDIGYGEQVIDRINGTIKVLDVETPVQSWMLY